MTQPQEAAGTPTASAGKPVGVFEPFQSRPFLWLWVGVVFSSVGSWAQTVGAQWLFINDPNAATTLTPSLSHLRLRGSPTPNAGISSEPTTPETRTAT